MPGFQIPLGHRGYREPVSLALYDFDCTSNSTRHQVVMHLLWITVAAAHFCYWIGQNRLAHETYCDIGFAAKVDGSRVTAVADPTVSSGIGQVAVMAGLDAFLRFIDDVYKIECIDPEKSPPEGAYFIGLRRERLWRGVQRLPYPAHETFLCAGLIFNFRFLNFRGFSHD